MADESVLELVSKVDEFMELHKLFQDADLDIALGHIVRLTMKPDIPPQVATRLIIQLQSISAKLYTVASFKKNVERPAAGTLEYQRKNVYYSMAEVLNDLVASLKYSVRSYSG